MVIAAIFAFYTKGDGPMHTIAIAVAIVIFMMGLMWLSSKTPSKHKDENEDGIS